MFWNWASISDQISWIWSQQKSLQRTSPYEFIIKYPLGPTGPSLSLLRSYQIRPVYRLPNRLCFVPFQVMRLYSLESFGYFATFCSHLDLLHVSLLINKQTGRKKKKREGKKEGQKESEICGQRVSKTRPVKILTGGFFSY